MLHRVKLDAKSNIRLFSSRYLNEMNIRPRHAMTSAVPKPRTIEFSGIRSFCAHERKCSQSKSAERGGLRVASANLSDRKKEQHLIITFH